MIFVALLVAVVTDPRPRLAASNSLVVASGEVLVVPPGEERCEQGQFVPAETATLRVYAGSDSETGGEPLRFSIADTDSAELVSRRRVDGGYVPGPLDVPVDPPQRDLSDGEVCIENLGSRPMVFAGNRTPLDGKALWKGAPSDEEIRIDFFRPGRESLWALAPEVARRFAVFKPAFAGPWLMWAVLTVALGAATAAVLLACRAPGPRAELPPGDER